MIGSNVPDLNAFFSKNMKNYQNIIDHGVVNEGNGDLKVKQIGLIGDSQANPRVLHTKQYNGEYGCIHCHQKGTTHEGSIFRTYPCTPDSFIRTTKNYKCQVTQVQSTGEEIKGIKGACWMAQFINIPYNIILDYMNVSCIGTMQQQLNLWNLS
jgi:hypothetical protein